jgi:transposase
LHVVLDNAGYHLTTDVVAYARASRIKFYLTPTGASWLNRIECHFTAMRKFALENTDHRTHELQQAAIQHYLAWRNRRRSISMHDWKSSRHRHRRAA